MEKSNSSKRIRVVFGLNDLAVGGMERQFVEQMRYMDRETFDVILVTLFQFPDKPELYDELPHDLEVHKLAFTGIGDGRSWKNLYALLRTLKPDIVVSSLFFSNTVFRILKLCIGYHVIAREHNTYADKPFLHQLIDRTLAVLTYRIVCVSKTVAEFTAHQEHIRASKFLVIPNGVDIRSMQARMATLAPAPELQQEMGFSAHDLVFLNIARLVPQKNHRLLIDGFLLFQKEQSSYKLAIVSDGGLRAELEAYVASRGAQETIVFFGYRKDFWKFYHFAQALVSTSRFEGLSNAMLEAFAAGVPIIATKTAGTDELIEDGLNGAFIQDATSEGVASCMRRFTAFPQNESRAHARATAQRYDIRKTVAAYETLFKEAAAI